MSSKHSTRTKTLSSGAFTCHYCHKKGHKVANCPVLAAKKKRKSEMVCHYCKQQGHGVKECPVLKAKKAREKRKPQRRTLGSLLTSEFNQELKAVEKEAAAYAKLKRKAEVKAAGVRARQQLQCKNSFGALDQDDEDQDAGAAASDVVSDGPKEGKVVPLQGAWAQKQLKR